MPCDLRKSKFSPPKAVVYMEIFKIPFQHEEKRILDNAGQQGQKI